MMTVLYVYLQIIHSYPPTVQEEPYHRMYHPRHYADRAAHWPGRPVDGLLHPILGGAM